MVAAITLTPATDVVGATITIAGTGFANAEAITLLFNGDALIPVAPITTDGTGEFSGTFLVPASVQGIRVVTATDVTLNTDVENFTVITNLVITEANAVVGSTINLTGTGFATVEAITFLWKSGAMTVVEDPVTSDATGGFVATFVVPASVNGSATVDATDVTTNTDQDTIIIDAQVILTEASGVVGATSVVTGTGYAGTSLMNFTFNAVVVTLAESPITTDGTGGWSGTLTIPAAPNGVETFVANDAAVNTDSDTLLVIALITISDASGSVGDTTIITGSGFSASSLVSYTFNSVAIVPSEAPVTSSSVGAFTATITVPAGHDDVITIVATDAGAVTDSITYNVLIIIGGEIVANSTYTHLSGRDNRLRSVNSVPSRERGAVVDITFTANDTYDTGGVTIDFSGIDNFSKVYLCKVLHNSVGLVCSFIPATGNAAASGKLKFWGTDGNELADNNSAITSKTLRLFIRGL